MPATCVTLSTTGVLVLIESTPDTDGSGDISWSDSASDPDGWSSAWDNTGNSNYLPLEDEFPEPNSVA
ncbi:hypothetical protein [Natrinema gelatinilyticum]|uniref:hypothetical protein n=1 Tax=Natrinema gelatinilyticum TaxID=2961571 RepID=UPI0020C42A55|nr:hypothetical protein [Natrinema gelatinilyticum]